MRVRPATREYRTWAVDSRRWAGYRPRPDDVVVATYPKCGTTWMQRIVGLLISQDVAAQPLMENSPWIDRRFGAPLAGVLAGIAAQRGRRSLKAHLPADGLPLYDEVRYIHVARDGRDACLSYNNHINAFVPEMLEALDAAGLSDETVARPYPRMPADPAAFFHVWLTEAVAPGDADGLPLMSYFDCERTWWDERHRDNVLLIHYADLKADLAGEMLRIAGFLDVTVSAAFWPSLVEAAGFEAMRQVGDILLGRSRAFFRGGAATFFNRGENGRWRGVFNDDDLALYAAKADGLPPDCARWLQVGTARTTGVVHAS